MKYHGEVLSLDGDTLFAIDSGDGLIEICMDDQTNIQLSVSMNNRQAQDLARHLLAASETSQPSPVATRAETEAAPELVAEAQGQPSCQRCGKDLKFKTWAVFTCDDILCPHYRLGFR